MARDTTPTTNHDYPRPEEGTKWSDDWDNTVESLDDDIPHELATGTITASGGASPAATVRATGVVASQTSYFDVLCKVDSDPSWNATYAFNYDVSRRWDDTDGEWDVDITVTWDTDPGSGNDLTLRYTVREHDLSA